MSTNESALEYIYVAQHVRKEGVLLQDCRNYEDEINWLEKTGLVKRAQWYRHAVVRLTESGKKKGSTRLAERIESNANNLRKAMNYIRPKIAHFLINYSILRLANDELSYPVDLDRLSPYSDWYFGTFNCVIVRGLVNELSEILFALERASCATRATYYVSTRGGETRERRIVICPEAIDFLTGYSNGLDEQDLPQQLRDEHVLYHGFHDYRLTSNWYLKQEFLTTVKPRIWNANVSRLKSQGVLQEGKDELIAPNRGVLEERLEQIYLQPIQSFLDGPRLSSREELPDDLNKRMESIGQKVGRLIDSILKSEGIGSIMQLLDPGVRESVQRRFDKKVAEDPRTATYEFLTLGELKDLIKRKRIWDKISDRFVNQSGTKPSPAKFHSVDLFFGCLDLVIAYRNPASHGVYLRPDATNLSLINATLEKLERILLNSLPNGI